jgi:hypothetical protein
MNHRKYVYLVEAEIEFTLDDIEELWQVARNHHDELYNFHADLTGFLTRWWNKAKEEGMTVEQVNFNTLDLLSKMLEGSRGKAAELWLPIRTMLVAMREEHKKANG